MSEKKSNGYIVVFQYTEKAGLYAGRISWTEYASKREFDQKYREKIKKKGHKKIIAEGVMSKKAAEMPMIILEPICLKPLEIKARIVTIKMKNGK
ncbi:MAG: hypothetical protein PHD51_01195 [Patescibacteria group bacterium]|nr:hypothetical protein [Patescibacteria group bacterium]MDD5490524.1 hypothetical protein [Patescibacteria group bacterium]